MGNSVIDYTRDGKCSCCQECCSDILPLTIKEIEAIFEYMNKAGVRPISRYSAFPEPRIDMRCCFIDDRTHRCMVYSVRPEICRKFICNQQSDTIEQNKNRVSRRKNSFNISMHVTFMREPHFITYIESNPYLSNTLTDVRVEVSYE